MARLIPNAPDVPKGPHTDPITLHPPPHAQGLVRPKRAAPADGAPVLHELQAIT